VEQVQDDHVARDERARKDGALELLHSSAQDAERLRLTNALQ